MTNRSNQNQQNLGRGMQDTSNRGTDQQSRKMGSGHEQSQSTRHMGSGSEQSKSVNAGSRSDTGSRSSGDRH